MDKYVILDRDGIINELPERGEYITSASEIFLVEGIIELLKYFKSKGYKFLIVTNQRGVALGKLSILELNEIHGYIEMLFEKHQLNFQGIYFCPHNIGECNCRKPLPGLIHRALIDHEIDLNESILIGDSSNDIFLANHFNLESFFVGGINKFASRSFESIDAIVTYLIQERFVK